MSTESARTCVAAPTFIQTVKTFPVTVVMLLFFTLVIRFSYFMAWPFLGIIMTRDYQMSPIAIGLSMTGSALLAVVLGVYGGKVSDSLGRRGILSLGCAFSFVGYALLALAGNMGLFIAGLLTVGVCFAWVDPPMRALMSDLLGDKRRRALALQIRYYLINLGAVTGPLVGIAWGLTSQKGTFLITALSYLPFLVWLLLFVPKGKMTSTSSSNDPSVPLRKVLMIIARDKLFIAALLCSILCSIVFVHYEAVVPLYLMMLDADSAVPLITLILVTNATTVLVAQIFLVRLLAQMAIAKRILLGSTIFALSQLGFLAIGNTDPVLWFSATVIFSIGEAILMPNLNILLDQLAPAEHRGAYMGASSLQTLGIAIGPLIGGVLLTLTGSGVFIGTLFFSLLLGIIMFYSRTGIQKRLQES